MNKTKKGVVIEKTSEQEIAHTGSFKLEIKRWRVKDEKVNSTSEQVEVNLKPPIIVSSKKLSR